MAWFCRDWLIGRRPVNADVRHWRQLCVARASVCFLCSLPDRWHVRTARPIHSLRDVTVEPHVHRIETDPIEGTLRLRRDLLPAVCFCVDPLCGIDLSRAGISHTTINLHLVS